MRKRSILALGGALAIIASLVVGPAATAGPERASAGTVVMVHDQEPGILNNFLAEGNGYTNGLVMNVILAGGVIYDNKAVLKPYLLTAVPKILNKEPLKATATYKQSAVWSDGKPITGADFLATYKTIMNPAWDIVSREGWEDIAKIQVKGKSFTVTFKPKSRVLRPGTSSSATRSCLRTRSQGRTSTSSGRTRSTSRAVPFKFQSWQRGTQLTMVRNPAFKAAAKAKIDRIVISTSLVLAVPGAEEPRGRRHRRGFAADSDRRLLQGPRLQGGGRRRLLVGAPRIPAGRQGPPGAEAEVRAPGHHHWHQPGTDPRRAVRKDRASSAPPRTCRFFRARYSSRSSPSTTCRYGRSGSSARRTRSRC